MRIHHLNCASMCVPGGRLIDGRAGLLRRAPMVCHCLLVETNDGLLLVDTGFGLGDIREAKQRIGLATLSLLGPKLDPEETALHQVRKLGFRPEDVRHIALTHLDLDHAGGLADFPEARVHIYGDEHRAAMAPRTFPEKQRYKAAQWAHGPKWSTYELAGEQWNGFDCVRQLDGLPPEILLVPLPGHSRGHCAVAVQGDAGWLLHAGDAYFFHGEMEPAARRCTPGLALFQNLTQADGRLRKQNQERLRKLAVEQAGRVQVFCAHDPVELERLRGAAGPEGVRAAAV